MSLHSILQTSKLPNYLMLWKHLQQNGKWSSPSWRHSQESVHLSCLWLPPSGRHALKILKSYLTWKDKDELKIKDPIWTLACVLKPVCWCVQNPSEQTHLIHCWWWWGLKDEWRWCFISYWKCVKYVGFGGVILHCSKAAYSKMPQVQVKTQRAVLDKLLRVKIAPLNFRPLVRSQNF
jgi:hypothetical protein